MLHSPTDFEITIRVWLRELLITGKRQLCRAVEQFEAEIHLWKDTETAEARDADFRTLCGVWLDLRRITKAQLTSGLLSCALR